MNTTLATYVKKLIETSILYYEPRIDLNKIELELDRQNEGILMISLDYTIRSTNSRFNFVYPFYLGEAEALQQQKLRGPRNLFQGN
jgi:phage baseplate assembly protein W